ncbi:hypothetical protein ACBJ59_10935 [Nonomuraea sp. MTCD27]|uniref:hypothetical protein n=1 Tax=Nonomuraea sp. MTCD27 TaxID=1676747 RepID=UPI0035C1829A
MILDLFCCIGGVARGYQEAGFRVIGVDINPQPDYAGDLFIQADALKFLRWNTSWIQRQGFVAAHASPPCQGEGAPAKGTNAARGNPHPRLIDPTRAALKRIGIPYVIENVAGSSVRKDITLCGEMFGLDVLMHRYFELGRWTTERPAHPKHRGRVRGWRHGTYFDGPYVAAYGKGGGKATVAEMQAAKGIDWSSDHFALREALPPAYGLWIGQALTAFLASRERAA